MVVRKGSGEPLLLIHGLGASGNVWAPVVDLLASEREVIVLDMPGFGDEPALPADVEPTAANLAAALAARCAELGVERPHVAGNSLGAWVGLEMGRAGAAASVTTISPAGLWRAPIGPRRRDFRAWAQGARPLLRLALRVPALRRRMLATFAAHPERIPAAAGRELVLGWVDSDGYETAPEYGDVILTSILKQMGPAVFDVISESVDGNFSNEPYVGTLENEGVALAPFHDFDAEVSDEMKAELEQLKADIISGTITVESQSTP